MKRYNSYHTRIKTCYSLGLEDSLLPQEFTTSIPRSTTQTWKDLNPEAFVGYEFADRVEADLEQVKLILDERLQRMKIMFYAFCRLYITVLEFMDKKNFEKIIIQNKEAVVNIIDNLPFDFNQELICNFLQISVRQFEIWKHNLRYKCSHSLVGYCTIRYPSQISHKELGALKSLTNKRRFNSWSLSSIWGFGIKNEFLSMSRSSFYRYCLKLNISIQRKLPKQKRKRESVMAIRSNEIWHMDVTEFMTFDFKKFYIHTVLDNFSRKVVAYTVSLDKTAKTRLISLKQAIYEVFTIDLSDTPDLDLIVDGGPENNNTRVHNFIRHCHVNINKKIALKDVRFSNSMIEGHFKILKRYLRSRGEIYSKDIHDEIAYFINDYNNCRPNYKHKIYTPNEVYENPNLSNVKLVLSQVNQERLETNRMSCCKEI